jgi:hypothetical protein
MLQVIENNGYYCKEKAAEHPAASGMRFSVVSVVGGPSLRDFAVLQLLFASAERAALSPGRSSGSAESGFTWP